MKTKEITPIQYSKWWGQHKSRVHKLLLENRIDELPHVVAVRKYSRFYTLEVPEDLTADSFIKLVPENMSD